MPLERGDPCPRCANSKGQITSCKAVGPEGEKLSDRPTHTRYTCDQGHEWTLAGNGGSAPVPSGCT